MSYNGSTCLPVSSHASPWVAPPASYPDVPSGEVHLWAVRLDLPPGPRAELAATLSPDELARANRLHFARDRQRWIAARGQLRQLLGRYLQRDPAAVTFSYACACGDPHCAHAHRKPFLADESWLSFNLSHARDLALVAVTRDRRLGVDLEYQRPAEELLPLAGTICAPSELAALQRLPAAARASALLVLWTCKEAYLKARGIGLLLAPQAVELALAPDAPPRLLRVSGDAAEAARWSVANLPYGPDQVAALAVEGQPATLRYWSLSLG